jgi:hypothetical protein
MESCTANESISAPLEQDIALPEWDTITVRMARARQDYGKLDHIEDLESSNSWI